MQNRTSFALLSALMAFLLGCQGDSSMAPQTTPPTPSGPTLRYYTFVGKIYHIYESHPGRAEARGIRVGDSVSYVFAVDTMAYGIRQILNLRTPQEDEKDRPDRRRTYFFDSLMTVPRFGRIAEQPSRTAYLGYRNEEPNGWAGTFLNHEYSQSDTTLKIAICFNNFAGEAALPALGDRVSGSESFSLSMEPSSIFLSSNLEVAAVGPVPTFPGTLKALPNP